MLPFLTSPGRVTYLGWTMVLVLPRYPVIGILQKILSSSGPALRKGCAYTTKCNVGLREMSSIVFPLFERDLFIHSKFRYSEIFIQITNMCQTSKAQWEALYWVLDSLNTQHIMWERDALTNTDNIFADVMIQGFWFKGTGWRPVQVGFKSSARGSNVQKKLTTVYCTFLLCRLSWDGFK